jgi:outer membrane receptor protein involved in Fe transport
MFTQNFGDPRTTLTQTTLSTFVQDDWRPRDGLFVNLGVRWDHSLARAVEPANNIAPRVGRVDPGDAGRPFSRRWRPLLRRAGHRDCA